MEFLFEISNKLHLKFFGDSRLHSHIVMKSQFVVLYFLGVRKHDTVSCKYENVYENIRSILKQCLTFHLHIYVIYGSEMEIECDIQILKNE